MSNRKHGAAGKRGAPRKLNVVTGFRVGTVGNRIGQAVIRKPTYALALKAALPLVRKIRSEKGKDLSPDVVHNAARVWLWILHKRGPGLYKNLGVRKTAEAQSA